MGIWGLSTWELCSKKLYAFTKTAEKKLSWSFWGAKTITDTAAKLVYRSHFWRQTKTDLLQDSLICTFCKLFCAWQRSYPLHTWQRLYIFLTPQFLIRLVNNQGKTKKKKTSSNSTARSEVRSLNVNKKAKKYAIFRRRYYLKSI